jgi:IS30 family transposase
VPRTRLILQEREENSLGMSRDISMRQLARQLGRDPTTVSREGRAGGV